MYAHRREDEDKKNRILCFPCESRDDSTVNEREKERKTNQKLLFFSTEMFMFQYVRYKRAHLCNMNHKNIFF